MEPRFGRDFRDVSIRIDSAAARAYQARAFTHGSSIVFDRGAYAPSTAAGQRLLAHELAHVVQQGRGRAPSGPLRVSQPSDRAEIEAARAADAAMSGRSHGRIAASLQAAAPGIYRDGPVPGSAPSTPAPDNSLDDKTKADIVDGKYADKGAYTVKADKKTIPVESMKKGKKVFTDTEVPIVDSTFTDPVLERAKRYLDANWAPGIDIKKSTGGGGDTKGKHISMPDWVYDYQNKLAAQKPRDYVAKAWERGNNPNWNEDSFLAQRLLEAFLRAWHKTELPDEKAIPSNLEQLYKRAGVSEKAYGNAQAQLLGDPNLFGWCGPASYNAVVLGLFKNGLRFKTPETGKYAMVTPASIEKNKNTAAFIRNEIKRKNKDISDAELDAKYKAELSKMALMAEVNNQAGFFITTNSREAPGWLNKERFATGDDAAWKYPLKPGDVITQALMKDSPVSGHVLTVVKEIPDPEFKQKPGTAVSTVYGISGNAGSIGGGSVKIEQFVREMPPASLKNDLGKMSNLGNRMTAAAGEREGAEKAARAQLATEQKVAPHKVSAADVGTRADASQAEKRGRLQASLTEEERKFKSATGMSYDAYVKAKNEAKPAERLKFIQIGQNQRTVINEIVRLRVGIRTIDDRKAVPEEAAKLNIAYSPRDTARYNDPAAEGGTGRFRPSAVGHMWIAILIKASEHANPNKINAMLNLSAEDRDKKIKELGWDINLTAAQYQDKILEKYGMERLKGSVESLWPGAIEAIEGEGLGKDYR
jgi:hypothetical protein